MIYEISDIVRTIDDHIDLFENIGVLLKEKDGLVKTTYRDFHRSNFN
jgi:hypothetical protein